MNYSDANQLVQSAQTSLSRAQEIIADHDPLSEELPKETSALVAAANTSATDLFNAVSA